MPIAVSLPACVTAKLMASMNPRSTSENSLACDLCPLTRVQAGITVRVRQLLATPSVQSRLRELGFCEDQVIRLITNRTGYICQVCNTRLALSEQMASLILVEHLQPVPVRVNG